MGLTVLDAPQPNVGLFPPEVGRLHVEGTVFRRDDNSLFQWRGYSWFLGFQRYCAGEDITPDLHWLRSMGFNIVRVFGPLPWVETPDYRVENFQFDKLPGFFQLLAQYGLRCNWSLGHYEHSGLKAHVRTWYEIAGGFDLVVAEVCNEPHIGKEKPNPIALLKDIPRYGVPTSYGLYGEYYDNDPHSVDPVLDFSGLHVQRDSAWHRKARHCQELQHDTDKPCISDEPAKITEPGFAYPGGKNDPVKTPQEIVWHAAVCYLWTPGFTFHCEEGKWGRVPTPGMLQHTCAEAVRDDVFTKIDAYWQTGLYNGSHMDNTSPVDWIDGIWTYSSLHPNVALSVRCAVSAPQPINGWRVLERWGPGGSIVRLER